MQHHRFASTASDGADERTKSYNRAKIWFFVIGILFSWIASALFVLTGWSARTARTTRRTVSGKQLGDSAATVVFMLLSWVASLPLSYLRGYRLEHKYELSNQSLPAWFGEQLKSLALQIVLLVPLTQGALAIIRRRPRDWWAVLSALAIPFTVVMVHLAPVVIAPLFNTYQPLRDQALADRLKRLAERSGIHVADVLEMDMSRQTSKANAFFTGIGNTKRIVLADTLIEKFTPEEIETIVAHEMAHQTHRDIWRLLAIGSVTTAAIAFATQIAGTSLIQRLKRTTGVSEAGTVEALPLLGLVASVVGMVLMPVQNAISRYIERKADRYALELTDEPAAFESALTRLQEMNLADPEPTRLEQVLLHSHPSIRERIQACRDYAEQREVA